MDLRSIVKYANAAYAGLMIGLAAYFVVLIKHGYTFVPSSSSSISIYQIFESGGVGRTIIAWYRSMDHHGYDHFNIVHCFS
ncbi:hypothetical protein [Vulcanisaeta distributa]|uniref:hypothetical protein n=1 Tax=Vulcanisaeta distributa TaxID=164451 RepID=UPI001FB4E4AF|nr:hypothetical protein [Vulcanisaeta distributa]